MRMWVGHVGQMVEISQCSRMTVVESNMKSEHNWLVKTPQRASFFCTFSFSSSPLSFYCTLTSLLSLSQCHQPLAAFSTRLCKYVRCGGPATLSYLSSMVKKPCPPSLGQAWHPVSSCVSARDAYVPLHAHEHKLTFLSVRHVRTYIHCENRSLIQSLKPLLLQIKSKLEFYQKIRQFVGMMQMCNIYAKAI